MYKTALHLIIFVFTFFNSYSQIDTIIDPIEEMPLFEGIPGGSHKFQMHLQRNLKYPEKKLTNVSRGIVVVGFTVDSIGQVTNIKIYKSLREDYDKEAIKVVSSSPKWTPGKVNGKAVNVNFTFSVIFEFPNNENEIKSNRRTPRKNKN